MKEVIQVFKIRDNFFFLQRDAPTYKNSCFIVYFILSFSFCFLYFVFDIYIKRFLRSNKTWLSERFPLLSRHELLLLEHFLFCFNSFRRLPVLIHLSSLLLWLFSLLLSLLLSLSLPLLLLLLHFQCYWSGIIIFCSWQLFLLFCKYFLIF